MIKEEEDKREEGWGECEAIEYGVERFVGIKKYFKFYFWRVNFN